MACAGLAEAQAQPPGPPGRPTAARPHTVMVDLVPMLASGYQVSVEKRWGPARRQALVLTPQLYYGTVQEISSAVSEGRPQVRGYGLALQHRMYLPEMTPALEGLYLGYGPQYQHFQLEFQAPSWQAEVATNGLAYYEYRVRPQQQTVDRYGLNAVVGNQFFLPDLPVFLDLYLGLGLRTSHTRATLPGNHFDRGMSDYGASGFYWPVGFRVGVAW
ncbi:hypothetical protein [Hymenobacter tenuis]